MLIGEYAHSLDTKGRVFIPAKFREELGQTFIVAQGIGKCLFVFSQGVWLEFATKLKNVPLTDQVSQVFLRRFFASASECEPDKQGRILLPSRLRKFAELEKDVTAIGVMTRVELWATENWEAYNNVESAEYEAALTKLAEFGI